MERVDITIVRNEGSDGRISCVVRTEALTNKENMENNAIEFEDYLPKCEKVTFDHGENEKVVPILLVNDKVHHIDGKTLGAAGKPDEDDAEDESGAGDAQDVMFMVKIEKAEPEEVKISKKNVCFVTIL